MTYVGASIYPPEPTPRYRRKHTRLILKLIGIILAEMLHAFLA